MSRTVLPVTGWWAVQESRYLAWSSSQFKISTSVPSARCQCVKSDCQHSLGWAAWNRVQEERGRLCGSGVIRPAACRILRMVEVEGGFCPACSRCHLIVTGPASRP